MSESKARVGHPWSSHLVSSVVGGVGGGLLVFYLVPARTGEAVTPDAVAASETPTEVAPPTGSATGVETDGERMDRLEASVKAVRKRQTEQAKVDVFEEAEESDPGKRITVSAADPKFQNAVRAVIDKAKWEADEDDRDRRDERQEKRIERRLEELTELLDLSDDQTDQVEIVLQARAEAFRDLREGENRPATRQEWREKFGEIQKETSKKLAGILDADQLATYEKDQEDQWGRGRR